MAGDSSRTTMGMASTGCGRLKQGRGLATLQFRRAVIHNGDRFTIANTPSNKFAATPAVSMASRSIRGHSRRIRRRG
jgi:hypothetical protein